MSDADARRNLLDQLFDIRTGKVDPVAGHMWAESLLLVLLNDAKIKEAWESASRDWHYA